MDSRIRMLAFAAAAAVASTGLDARAQEPRGQEPSLPPGATVMTLDEGEQIRDTLGAILNSIVTEDEFSDVVDFESMVDYLAAPDRRRIGDVDEGQLRQLTSTVESLEAAWRGRFPDDDLGEFDEDEVFSAVPFVEGRISDPARLAAHWPVRAGERPAPAAEGTTGRAGVAGAPLERDTDIAVAHIRGVEGEDPVPVSLINERFDRWRVDVPDSVTAGTLIANLQQELEKARRDASKWPASRDAAHRYIAHRVLAALYDVDSGMTSR